MGRPTKYPEQFGRDAVELVESAGRPIAEVTRSLSINEGTLWNWVRDARRKQAHARPVRRARACRLQSSRRDTSRRSRRYALGFRVSRNDSASRCTALLSEGKGNGCVS